MSMVLGLSFGIRRKNFGNGCGEGFGDDVDSIDFFCFGLVLKENSRVILRFKVRRRSEWFRD